MTIRENFIHEVSLLEKECNASIFKTVVSATRCFYLGDSINEKPLAVKNHNNGISFIYENKEKTRRLVFNFTENAIHVRSNGIKWAFPTEFDIPKENIYVATNLSKLFFHPKTEKLCLFTGAFNPPTIAHYHMIDSAMEAGNFDFVVYAASNQKFLDKKQSKVGGKAYSETERLNFLLAMTRDRKDTLVFGIEQGYTYDVLCKTKETFKAKEVFFALGSDKLKEIGRWGHHNELLRRFCFYVLQRGDTEKYIENKCKELFCNTKYVVGTDNQKYKDISATQVREKIEKGEDFKTLVHETVYELLKSVS